jgi:acyl-CoA hydrolase
MATVQRDGKEWFVAIREAMMPRDTNQFGHIFGGHILSLIDLAALQQARRVAPLRYVTKVMREVNFIAPVFVGDLVSFLTTTKTVGNTSITIAIEVEAMRGVETIETVHVTSAEVIMVAVAADGKPVRIRGGIVV